MEEAKKVAINIVAWNSLSFLQSIFVSLQEQDCTDFSVTVVDNASDDGTAKWLMDNRPDVAVLRNFRNQPG